MTDKTAPRVTITHHPDAPLADSRRLTAEGLRALYPTPPLSRTRLPRWCTVWTLLLTVKVNDLMLPVASAVVPTGLSVIESSNPGGSGLQTIRSSSTSGRQDRFLYEGTTAIQAQDFFFSGQNVQTRATALANASQIQGVRLDSGAGNGRLKTERALARALTDVQ